ncbi:MAG: pyruvate dehydrogenase complex dihydrolipoamide acetyltransferase [Chlamydiae bacterium]|nr:pyruvate dehydrogenase complex dihydrolipoamide acetyltransferase [Chlamydiota bacterium]
MPFTLTMPKLSPTMEEGTIVKWHAKVGDKVNVGDVLFEVATDKATVEHSALEQGFLRKILVGDGQLAKVNQPVAIFTEKKEESIEGYLPEGVVPEKAPEPAAKEVSQGLPQPQFIPEKPVEKYEIHRTAHEPIVASPLAKKMAKEKGVDLSTVKGSGPGGRIMSRDLELGEPIVGFGRREMPKEKAGSFEEIPLSPIRKIVAKRLQESKTFIPHFYVTQEMDASSLFKTREELKSLGMKFTFNDFVIRAAALALKEHPHINSGFNSASNAIIRFKTIDISVAVTLEEGLITPIILYADRKNLAEISSEMKDLAERAKAGKLAREEYMGGSFTVSNLGMYAISEFIAVINPPQAAILAVGGIQEKPVVKEGQVVPGKTITFTLSADHRVIDGVDSAKFLKTLQQFIESPSILLLS